MMITLSNGNLFCPVEPDPKLFDIEVIVKALIKICRFNGHCKQFYSVAQHSLLVAQLVPEKLQLPALLHDAHEALSGFGDVCSTVKTAEIIRTEKYIDVIIAKKYGFVVDLFYHPQVKQADLTACATEVRDLMDTCSLGFPQPLTMKIVPDNPSVIYSDFLSLFNRIKNQRGAKSIFQNTSLGGFPFRWLAHKINRE